MAADQQDLERAYATSGSLNRPLCQIFDVQQASNFESHGMATCAVSKLVKVKADNFENVL